MSELTLSPAEELLTHVRVAAPCAVSWETMAGGDRVRSCERCQHKVYNLSEMSAVDAAALLKNSEGKLCVRFYRRSDGTVMTRDCPVGARAVRVRLAKGISVAFASLMTVCGLSLVNKPRAEYPFLLRLLMDRVAPEPTPPIQTMGEMQVLPMAPPSPPPTLAQPTGSWTMGDVAPVAIMGKVRIAPAPKDPTVGDLPPTPEAAIDPTEAADKSFLRGVDDTPRTAPREDPFAPVHPR